MTATAQFFKARSVDIKASKLVLSREVPNTSKATIRKRGSALSANVAVKEESILDYEIYYEKPSYTIMAPVKREVEEKPDSLLSLCVC
ncbi:unnamed protein product [Cylicostephanus goldi]|uniref:Uncharacterized protein n=1 Tax=Cylicostephanus goldi TaxID=71465 RepID=A0A3P6RAE3_CYLGO|nr:unnamed protein product [Cylicostephanus goldi]